MSNSFICIIITEKEVWQANKNQTKNIHLRGFRSWFFHCDHVFSVLTKTCNNLSWRLSSFPTPNPFTCCKPYDTNLGPGALGDQGWRFPLQKWLNGLYWNRWKFFNHKTPVFLQLFNVNALLNYLFNLAVFPEKKSYWVTLSCFSHLFPFSPKSVFMFTSRG